MLGILVHDALKALEVDEEALFGEHDVLAREHLSQELAQIFATSVIALGNRPPELVILARYDLLSNSFREYVQLPIVEKKAAFMPRQRLHILHLLGHHHQHRVRQAQVIFRRLRARRTVEAAFDVLGLFEPISTVALEDVQDLQVLLVVVR